MLKIMKIHIVTLFLCAISLIFLLMFTGYAERGVSWDIIKEQRSHPHIIFLDWLADADFSQLLFGHGGCWSGWSITSANNYEDSLVIRIEFSSLINKEVIEARLIRTT